MVHHKIHDEELDALGPRAQRGSDGRASSSRRRTAATLNLAANAAQARARLEEDRQGVRRRSAWPPPSAPGRPRSANPAVYAGQGRRRRRALRRRPRRRRVLLGGGRALHDDRQGRLQGVRSRSRPTSRRSRRRGPARRGCTRGDLGERRSAGIDLAGRRPERHRQAGHRGDPQEPSSPPPTRTWRSSRKQGYRVPFAAPAPRATPGARTRSCSTTRSCSALAHDFTHDGRYLNGVAAAMDYILGRNPLDQSYVTG